MSQQNCYHLALIGSKEVLSTRDLVKHHSGVALMDLYGPLRLRHNKLTRPYEEKILEIV